MKNEIINSIPIFIIILLMIIAIYVDYKTEDVRTIKSEMDVDLSTCKVINSHNTKSWMGDGDYVVILDCLDNNEDVIKQIEKWEKCPMQDEKYAYIYEYMAEQYNIPEINSCYYLFIDASPNKDFLSNFILSIYDTENKKFYYIDYDS